MQKYMLMTLGLFVTGTGLFALIWASRLFFIIKLLFSTVPAALLLAGLTVFDETWERW